MKKISVLVFLLSLNISFVFSQTFNTIEPLCDTCEQKIFLNIKSTSFFKNNEYFQKFTESYTGVGFFIKPTIEYYLNKDTKVNAGIYLLKYSGKNKFTQTIPIFSVQHKLTKNIEIVFGSLYSTLNHKLEEPMFRFDRYYENNVEYGFQILYNTSLIESDLWINWEQFILKDDPYQEEFVVGNNTDFKIFTSTKFKVYIPLEVLFCHKGGQIDSSPNSVSTIFNGLTGLKFDYKINKTNTLGFEPLFLWYKGLNLSDEGCNMQLFKNGKGFYNKIKYDNNFISAMLGYWIGKKFISPKGEYLFQSVSERDYYKSINFSEKTRKIITAKIALKRNLANSFKIKFGADAYYDVINKKIAYSYSLYFLINESYFLGENKKHLE